tara:strand:- start:9552 stop:9782 length:231 start_codon:yes stop_codon:yes gene_type:complete
MAVKKFDVAIKTGEYNDNDGVVKGRYENVGSVMANDDGGFFMIMKRTFNPAGIANPDDKDSIILGLFDTKKKDFAE